jgi:hypothetical protein
MFQARRQARAKTQSSNSDAAVMKGPANYYLRTAAEYEARARDARDPATKREYEDIAKAYRQVARHSGTVLAQKKNAELDALAEAMVRNTNKTL